MYSTTSTARPIPSEVPAEPQSAPKAFPSLVERPATPSRRQRRGRLALTLAIWAGVLLPLAALIVPLPLLGRLQKDDYYGVMRRLSDGDQWSTDPSRWWNIRIFEHRVLLPATIWVANFALTRGDNRVIAAISILFLAILFAILVQRLPRPPTPGDSTGWVPTLLLSLYIFSPGQMYNIHISFGGTHYFLADILAVLAICTVLGNHRSGALFVRLLVLGVLGILSFSSHLAVWPALALGVLFAGRRWRTLIPVLAAGLASAAFYVSGTRQFANHAKAIPDPEQVIRYLGTFLGGIYSRDLDTARLIGWGGLGMTALVFGWIYWRGSDPDRKHWAFWIMLQIYAVGCGLLAALGRGDQGEAQALASRYMLYPCLFWLALFIPMGVFLIRHIPHPRRPLARTLAVPLILLSALPLYQHGFKNWSFQIAIGMRQDVADHALRLGIWDEALIRATVSRVPKTVHERLPLLENLGHVPFDRPRLNFEVRSIDPERVAPKAHPDVDGVFVALFDTDHPRYARARGWVHSDTRRIEEIVFLDVRHRVVSRILLGQAYPHVRDRIGFWNSWTAGWEGFVLRNLRLEWTAYCRVDGDPRFYPLKRGRQVELHFGENRER